VLPRCTTGRSPRRLRGRGYSRCPRDADAQLAEQLRRAIAAQAVRAVDAAPAQRAAVAVTVVEEGLGADLPGLPRHLAWSRRAALLLTRRAAGLKRHAGQWSFPGGRIEPGESPEVAALRELHEEVGLQLGPEALLGRLDDFSTCSGFVITPVVAFAGAARELELDGGEVASAHRIPLIEFERADAPWLDPLPGSEHPVLRMPVGGTWIAAPTAALIYQLVEWGLRGRGTRVAHYEQPTFAWR
jgi:8-oxo-dGTP pyrophosphatase MutT (NUDIX family)